MDSRASTRTRLSVLPVFIALLFNVMVPIATVAVPDAAPDAFQPQVAEGANAPERVTFTLEGCNLDNGSFIEATTTCTEPAYTTGNLGKLWAELDRVPHRLTAENKNGAQTYEIKLSADHLDDGFLGYDLISVPTLKSGPCTFTTSAQFVDAGVAGGADSTISRTLIITQPADSTCVFDYNMRLALGSAQYPGSSLRAYLIAEGVGQKSVPLPVTKDFPAQQLRKTMAATQGQAYRWAVSKSSTPTSLNFPNTCLTTPGARSANVSVTVSWTRSGPTAAGATTITTQVYANNPSERMIQVTATDNIYTGAAATNSEATRIATKAGGLVNVPANSEVLVLTHTFEYTGSATQFNDVATATYTDPLNPDVTIPGNTTAAASATTQPAGGQAGNATAIITDTESITGTGLSFSVAAPASGSFTNGYVAGEEVLPGESVAWSSGVVDGSGSITFNKTVSVDQARITSGTLSDTATVLSADGQQTLATSGQLDIGITTDASVSLTINKTIPSGALRTGESVTFDFAVYAGPTATGTPIATPSISFTAGGDTAKSVTLTDLDPGTYTVREVPEAGWATLDNQSDTITLPDCSGSVSFDNTELRPDLDATKVADAPSVSAGSQIGFVISVWNGAGIGTGVAKDVETEDALPDAAGLDWSIAGDSADGGVCSIDGALGEEVLACGFGDLAPGESASVHVVSDTTADSCGEYRNTVDVWGSNVVEFSRFADVEVLCPDPSVTKTADVQKINAEDPATFDVTVHAGGTGPSTNVEVTDLVPAGHSWTVTGDIADCVGYELGDTELVLAGGETLSCTYATIANDASKSLSITSTSTTDDCADGISNTVTIGADADVDPSEESNSDTAIIEVECPDLRLLKSGSGTVIAGASVDFVIDVDNIGDGDAYDVVMTDDLPELASGSWAIFDILPEDSLVTCEITDLAGDEPDAETVLLCEIAELASGDGFSVTVRATTTVGDCPMLSNDALVEASNEDEGDLDNNADSHDITVNCPDVSVTKEATVPSVDAGRIATFEITIEASGFGPSENVTLTDQLDGDVDDWSFAVSGDGSDEDCSISESGLLTCLFGTLQPDDSITVALSYETDAGDCPAIANQASVSATADVDGSDNASELVSIDVNCPDLEVTKEWTDANGDPTEEPVSAGDLAYFEIIVKNVGLGTAFHVHLFDEPESGTWTVVNDGGFDCPASIGPDGASCTAAELAPGTYTLLLSYETSVPDCGTIQNDVTVSASNEPAALVTLANSDSATAIVACPGLNIVKIQVDENGEPTTEPILAGDTAYFEILVWNEGPGVAKDVMVNDDLPAGVEWQFEITDGDGECFPASSQEEGEEPQMSLLCDLGDLDVDESVTILVWGETTRETCGALTNVATVDGSNNDDEVPAEEATILVSCPEIALSKANDAVGSVLPGTTITYTLTLTVSDQRLENGEATDVTVIDVMPDGLEGPTGFDPDASFDAETRTITWNLGTLGEGTYELTYQAVVADDVEHGEELVNAAAATSPDSQCPDLESLGPECEDTSTIVVRVPTLVIDKEADADLITITIEGDEMTVDPEIVTWTLTYTLTNGPVTNAVISDEVPDGLIYVDGSASHDGAYDPDTNTLTWTFEELSASGSVTFETEVDPETISRVAPTVNVAVISSDQTAEDEGEDEVTVTVEQEAGGNPTPTPTPAPRLPDTAIGIGIGGEPISVPVELLAVAFLGSLGAMALVNVKATRSRRR